MSRRKQKAIAEAQLAAKLVTARRSSAYERADRETIDESANLALELGALSIGKSKYGSKGAVRTLYAGRGALAELRRAYPPEPDYEAIDDAFFQELKDTPGWDVSPGSSSEDLDRIERSMEVAS